MTDVIIFIKKFANLNMKVFQSNLITMKVINLYKKDFYFF